MKHLTVASIAFASVLVAGQAFAGPLIDQSAGLKLFLGADVWTAPSNVPPGVSAPLDGSGGGFGYGGAAYYELRLIKLVGIEADLAYQHGPMHRTVTSNGVDTTYTLTTNSWRLPILAKLNIPLGLGRFWVGLGPEFTLASSSSVKVETDGNTATQSNATRDVKPVFGTGGLGLVIEIPLTGIEIPLEFRASKNLSQPSNYSDRFDTTTVRAESSWVFRLGAGVGYQF